MRLILTIAALFCSVTFGQTFEVASVKKNTTGERPSGDAKGGQFTMFNMPMKVLIARGYGVTNDKVVGPDWLDTDGFDIVAKMPKDVTEQTLWVMVKNLLVERFKLAAHHEASPMPVYALVVAKNGPKLQPAAADSQTRDTCKADGRELTCKSQKSSMADLVRNFPRWMSRNWFDMPIVDQTGLTGVYDFSLTWTMTRRIDDNVDPPAYSFLDALQEQLGLKLEQRKAPVDRVVVDHMERVPTEN
ncbi:conserved exported hypothetical protein [Candidatus Sulfopaludibacter sp. SbA3]|nr:conserved exported hypothetical protein [Candidatus Sulfopaludibacter sp. SbA3]